MSLKATDMKILVVDDEVDLLEMISMRFQIFGFHVDTASSIDEASDLMGKKDYNILITDVRMPNGSGVDLLKRVKHKNPNQPTVFLVSGYMDFSLEDVFDYGADGLFAKPFEADVIKEAILKSMLILEDRWKKNKGIEVKSSIVRGFESLQEAAKSHKMNWGRGGFFVECEQKVPLVGDYCSFEIHLEDQQPCASITGVGRVRWSRIGTKEGLVQGVGLEIESFDEECLQAMCDWMRAQKFVSYIPRS